MKFESARSDGSVILKENSGRREHIKRKNTGASRKDLATTRLTPRRLRLLGILPLGFFTAQAIHYWHIQQLGHTLWMCNIGNLLLAIGLFFEQAMLIRVAVIWMVPGVLVWCVYVVPTWGILLTGRFSFGEFFGVVSSTLAHLGGFSVGIVVLRKVRLDSKAWLFAFLWYFVVQMASRLVTPAELNVNLSHNVQPGWEGMFTSYLKFWLVLSSLVGICLWLLGWLLRFFWPEESSTVNHPVSPSS
jgi:hypothetical protein